MKRTATNLARRLLGLPAIANLPVRVRSGIAQGARWTLYPWTSYWRGTHEPALQASLLALGGGNISGWTCWDLGAHYGLYSVGLARRTGPQGQVVSFEPNPVSFARLERHRRMNQLDWLLPFEAAVSDVPGTAEFYTYGELESTTTHLPYEGETRSADCAPVTVRLQRLDDLVAEKKIRLPQFVKVDVEGHAHRALAGARESLAAARPILIVAFHSDQEASGVRALLDPLGYRSSVIATHSGSAAAESGHDFLFEPLPRPRG